MAMKKVLVVGSGPKELALPREFQAYKATRLDINPAYEPDIVASCVAMPMIEDETYDAAFASHVMEHLYFHEVAMSLRELARVVRPGGMVKIQVPDLQCIGGQLGLDKADAITYTGGMGAVTPLDMLYGHRGEVAKGNLWMAHKTGFTGSVLQAALTKAGFVRVEIDRDSKFELVGRGHKPDKAEEEPVEENGEQMPTSASEADYARAV